MSPRVGESVDPQPAAEVAAADLSSEITWCLVPGAWFVRGSRQADEQPCIAVRLSTFQISQTPVTNVQYEKFLLGGGYDDASLWTKTGWKHRTVLGWTEPNYWRDPAWCDPDGPVTGISWWEARAFAHWAGCEIPTEAQWEYAAKGPRSRLYPWGDHEPTDELATYSPECEPFDRRGTPVTAHPHATSPFGCLDMAGNVAEWCLDNARPNYRDDLSITDPVFITIEGDDHIARGGCGLHDASYLRCTSRDYYTPGLRDNLVGIRLARPVPQDAS
jgi:gamma-glutamyl hercynylcysteine S-oxide synthase